MYTIKEKQFTKIIAIKNLKTLLEILVNIHVIFNSLGVRWCGMRAGLWYRDQKPHLKRKFYETGNLSSSHGNVNDTTSNDMNNVLPIKNYCYSYVRIVKL